jgi:hypothetical protein
MSGQCNGYRASSLHPVCPEDGCGEWWLFRLRRCCSRRDCFSASDVVLSGTSDCKWVSDLHPAIRAEAERGPETRVRHQAWSIIADERYWCPDRACPNRTSVKDACSCPTRVACAITDTYPRGSWSSTDSLRSTDGPGSVLAFRELRLCPERVVVAVSVDILAVGMGLR